MKYVLVYTDDNGEEVKSSSYAFKFIYIELVNLELVHHLLPYTMSNLVPKPHTNFSIFHDKVELVRVVDGIPTLNPPTS